MNEQIFAGLLHALEELAQRCAFNSKKQSFFLLVHTYSQFGVILIIHAVL